MAWTSMWSCMELLSISLRLFGMRKGRISIPFACVVLPEDGCRWPNHIFPHLSNLCALCFAKVLCSDPLDSQPLSRPPFKVRILKRNHAK